MFIAKSLAVLVLMLMHYAASELKFIDRLPRTRWLSFAGGVGTAYVFLELLPELDDIAAILREHSGESLGIFQDAIWMVALLGLLVYYGLEKVSQRQPNTQTLFWVNIMTFSVYNGLIGYLLIIETYTVASLILYVTGLGLHFLVNDHGLKARFEKDYRTKGRWILVTAIAVGSTYGALFNLDELFIGFAIAFTAGGIVLNTFKEEIPANKDSAYSVFIGGALLYASIILVYVAYL